MPSMCFSVVDASLSECGSWDVVLNDVSVESDDSDRSSLESRAGMDVVLVSS